MSAEASALSDGGTPQGIRRFGRRSDETLCAIAARGNRDAFEAVYERHHQALYRYCLSILGHHEDAWDAVQNAMLKAWEALRSGGPTAPLRPWLFRVAHNEAITVIRRRRTHGRLEDVSTAASSVEETVDTRLRLDRLRADLEAMPPRRRRALLLRELCGLRHDEIAAVLDVSTATARQTVHEARVALHEAEAGRELPCEIVRRTLSDGDGRVRRGRRIRNHLGVCPGCASFDQTLRRRPGERVALPLLEPGATVAGPMPPPPATAGTSAAVGDRPRVESLTPLRAVVPRPSLAPERGSAASRLGRAATRPEAVRHSRGRARGPPLDAWLSHHPRGRVSGQCNPYTKLEDSRCTPTRRSPSRARPAGSAATSSTCSRPAATRSSRSRARAAWTSSPARAWPTRSTA